MSPSFFLSFCSLSAPQPSLLSHQADAPSRRRSRRPSPAGIAPGQPAGDPSYMATHAQASQELGEEICFPNASSSCASLAPRTDEMQLEELGSLGRKEERRDALEASFTFF